MEEKLLDKLRTEYRIYKKEVKERGVEYAIYSAYEITAKQEIIDCIECDCVLSKTEIKALLSKKDLLDELYQDWISFDGNMREHINYSVDKSLESIVNDYKKEHIKSKNDAR